MRQRAVCEGAVCVRQQTPNTCYLPPPTKSTRPPLLDLNARLHKNKHPLTRLDATPTVSDSLAEAHEAGCLVTQQVTPQVST